MGKKKPIDIYFNLAYIYIYILRVANYTPFASLMCGILPLKYLCLAIETVPFIVIVKNYLHSFPHSHQ